MPNFIQDFNADEDGAQFRSLMEIQEEMEEDRRGFMAAPKKRGKKK